MNSKFCILQGNALDKLKELPDNSIHTCITSPPYFFLRDYDCDGQVGLEKTPEEYIKNITIITNELKRVLRNDGTFWINLGDSCVGNKIKSNLHPKNLLGIPWATAFSLRDNGWILRKDIIWSKRNPLPSSTFDRPTSAHEYIFLFSKSPSYYYDYIAVREEGSTGSWEAMPAIGGKKYTSGDDGVVQKGIYSGKQPSSDGKRNKRSVWDYTSDCEVWNWLKNNVPEDMTEQFENLYNKWLEEIYDQKSVWDIPTHSFKEAHFATFPVLLPQVPILAGTSEKGCCPICNAPLKRIIESERQATRPAINNKKDKTGKANRDPERHITKYTTIGWEKTCKHDFKDKDIVPCTVLDIFSGAATTGIVAAKYNRNYVGIELNPEYIKMSKKRLRDFEPIFLEEKEKPDWLKGK
jgi:DNA modification methylase